MKSLFFVIWIIFGCASNNTSAPRSSGVVLPEWIEKTENFCTSNEICAIGEGTGLMLAEASARANIAKFFKTKIQSKFQQITTLDNSTNKTALSEQIDELADDVLNGIIIKDRFESKDGFYVLASLSKSLTKKYYKEKLDEIDGQIRALYKNNEVGDLAKILLLLEERSDPSEKYFVVADHFINPPVSKEVALDKITDLIQGVVIKVNFSTPNSDEIKTKVESIFSAIGYKLIVKSEEENQATHIVDGEFLVEKMHLKVIGFEKQKFSLKLTASKVGESQKKVIQTEAVATGRDISQSLKQGVDQIKDYLSKHLAELNIQK